MKPYLIILYLIVLVATGATADGLNETGQQGWGHLLESIELLMAFSFVFLFKLITWREFILALVAYTFFRVAGFDYIHNLVAGNTWDYICEGENCNWWDQLLSNWEPGGVAFARFVFFVTGISIPFKYLR